MAHKCVLCSSEFNGEGEILCNYCKKSLFFEIIYFLGEHYSHEILVHHLTLYNCPICGHTKNPFDHLRDFERMAKKSQLGFGKCCRL